jgi:predicted DNA-binding protein (MmcQ/YjbR family)
VNVESFREYCLSKKNTTESFPFDTDTLVFKVADKLFALISLSKPDRCNLKCEPAYAIQLRSEYGGIEPGYHMNKQHWNTVYFNADVPDSLIYALTDHSYEQVVLKLPVKIRKELGY